MVDRREHLQQIRAAYDELYPGDEPVSKKVWLERHERVLDEIARRDQLLTTEQLCARWHMTPETLSVKYRKMGLRPLRISKRLLFRMSDILTAELRSIEDSVK